MKKVSLWLLMILTVALSLKGQKVMLPPDSKKAVSDQLNKNIALFSSDELLDIAIRFDLTSYLKKKLNGGSLNGYMTFFPGTEDSVSRNITIRTRGAFRYERCSFAPMEIGLKKSLFAYADSGKIKKLKLVTHCEPGAKYDDYVMKEYLVYKLYNILTDTSYKVRLLRVNYIDTEKERKPLVQYGIFIEPKPVLAKRVNCAVVSAMSLKQTDIQPGVMDRVAIFSYMIGSWDWAVQSLHNIHVLKPLKYESSGLGIAVPYDFDLTGVVDPDYNMPPAEMGISSNKDRLYMGICRDREVYRKALNEFISKKDQFYRVINEFPYLGARSKKEITNYLDTFFNQLGRERDIEYLISQFLNSCKKI